MLLGLLSVAAPARSSVPACFGVPATIVGTSGPDQLAGTTGRDVIVGLGGNDALYGYGGNDLVCGGPGDDALYGDDGNDQLRGDDGNDVVIGGRGNDTLLGNAGNDVLYGDGVIGSKLHRGSRIAYPWRRRILSLGYYVLVRALFRLPVHDTQTGLKLYRREVLERIPFELNSDDFVFDTQFLVQAVRLGYRLGDVPVPVRYFPEASSINFKRSLRYGVATVGVVTRYWMDRFGIRRWKLFQAKQPAGK